MGVFVAGAAAVASGIAAAASAVASVVSTVVSAVAAAAATIASAISATVASIVGAVSSAISTISSAISTAVASINTSIIGPIAEFAGSAWKYASGIYNGIKAITEALHLKTIMKVHNIAYILSKDYRQMVNRIYYKIADIARAAGGSEALLVSVFKNAETLVKNVGAVMGRSYDLADVTWLKTLKGYMDGLGDRIKGFENAFLGVIHDIDENIIKPTLDTLADMQKNWFSLLESMGDSVEETLGKIRDLWGSLTGVRDSLNQLVSDLPDTIQDEVRPWIDEINEGFNDFKEDVYQPFMNGTNDLIDMLRGKADQHRSDIDGIVDRLLRPGDFLKEIDGLPHGTRIDQENKVGEIASRPMEREAGDLEKQASDTFEHLEKIRAILEEEMPPPEWRIPERPEPVMPKGGQSAITDTWYVGDY